MTPISKKKQIVELCRENRKNMTDAERILWNILRNRQLDGKKFLRQHKIIYENAFDTFEFFILDFYCAEEKLVLEIDGGIHESQKEFDLWRSSVLDELGMRVLRLRNEETTDKEYIKNKIRDMFNSPPSPSLQEERG